jgi:hypothetical protein
VEELADGGTRWELDVASSPTAAGLPFTIERLGLETPRAA